VDVQYQCDLKDYLEAQNVALKATAGYYIVSIGGILSLVLGVLASLLGLFGAAWPMLALAVFWLSCPIFYWPWKLRRDFKKHPNFSRQCSLHVDENGLRSESDVSSGETKWEAFVKFRETPNLFMMYFGGRMFKAIPKRAFSAPQLEEFRDLLRSKLPAK
jgi:hypothetical protein